jgi:hypothetical protein
VIRVISNAPISWLRSSISGALAKAVSARPRPLTKSNSAGNSTAEEVQNNECRVMNEKIKTLPSSITLHSSFCAHLSALITYYYA